MTKISLKAGDIKTDVRCDDSEIDAVAEVEKVAETAKMLQQWQMRQWTEVSGDAVSLRPTLGWDR